VICSPSKRWRPPNEASHSVTALRMIASNTG
jgi:hypothetical protein